MSQVTQKVPFRLIVMPCCQHMFCSVNHRWPTYCPSCGTMVYPEVRGCATVTDENATLKYKSE